MPPNSEIEKLERRWKENPKGTVFAPYAEVLRKHGDHPQAREVLRQGLELHPDHIPGNIVLGRCCLDLGEDGPAEAAFTHVLELDSENVIALKALADITERQGRLLEASHWLTRLVSVDPSNDEARDQLARVEATREAAAAVITGQISSQGGAARPPESAIEEPSSAEMATGVIETGEYPSAIIDASARAVPPRPAAPPPPAPSVAAQLLGLEEAETVPVIPTYRPPRIHDLEVAELDLAEAAAEAAPEQVEGIQVDEPFSPPAPEPVAEAAPVPGLDVTIAAEESAAIEIRPSGATEFQAPDHSSDLLSLKPGASEFQVPDASSELSLRVSGSSEFQTPSGSEELLAKAEQAAEEPVAPEPVLETPVGWASTPYSIDLAAVSEAPTVELPSRPLPTEPAPEAESEPPLMELEEPAEEASVAAGAEPVEPEGQDALVDEALPEEPALEEAASAADPNDNGSEPLAADAEEERVPDAVPASLKLIFPDERTPIEAPRRRISEEALEPTTSEAATTSEAEPVGDSADLEPHSGEPELVVTETMAELYLRQGHLEEAANVYRVLLARQPDDARLAGRLRVVEAEQQAGRRRLSYVASDTGGESVESFFRALAAARPGSTGAQGTDSSGAVMGTGAVDEGDQPAPTRPASGPLSLSAIFGEEPSSPARSPAPPTAPAPARPGPDAFSFDQFFGAAPGGQSQPPSVRQSGVHRDEDLDQFQHWLKSLKR